MIFFVLFDTFDCCLNQSNTAKMQVAGIHIGLRTTTNPISSIKRANKIPRKSRIIGQQRNATIIRRMQSKNVFMFLQCFYGYFYFCFTIYQVKFNQRIVEFISVDPKSPGIDIRWSTGKIEHDLSFNFNFLSTEKIHIIHPPVFQVTASNILRQLRHTRDHLRR